MSNLGMGVMLGMLRGNSETVNAVTASLGKTIEQVCLEDNVLQFLFTDGTKLNVWDGGQSCCESRYMCTDDDLIAYAGTGHKLVGFEIKDATSTEEEDGWGGEHEIQFLDVITDKERFQIANHNEHNGYYGGFLIEANSGDKPNL